LGKRKNLTEKHKEVISYLYHNTNASLGVLAQTMGCSIDTILKYKNYTLGLTNGITKAPKEKSKEENKKEDHQDIVIKPKNDIHVTSLDHF